ncbi:MAG: YlmH/Sll1252 family protein [Eubacteriales bacterium]|nr:YlmH/Sll1252 family protein [Eubacteriales bacterium]
MDQLRRARGRGIVVYTRFLDPAQAAALAALARREGVPVQLCGGYEGAERCVAALLGGDMSAQPPIAPLWISWDARFAAPAHRDILGALMNLGVERDSFGDILVQEGKALVWVLEELAAYVQENLLRAGRASVQVSRAQEGQSAEPDRETREIVSTVSSLRLDALVGIAYAISREKAAQAIRAGLVKLNHVPEQRCDALAQEGAVLSLAGKGRAVLTEIGGVSRKGRRFIRIQRYL